MAFPGIHIFVFLCVCAFWRHSGVILVHAFLRLFEFAYCYVFSRLHVLDSLRLCAFWVFSGMGIFMFFWRVLIFRSLLVYTFLCWFEYPHFFWVAHFYVFSYLHDLESYVFMRIFMSFFVYSHFCILSSMPVFMAIQVCAFLCRFRACAVLCRYLCARLYVISATRLCVRTFISAFKTC